MEQTLNSNKNPRLNPMNKFLIMLKGDMNDDIRRYFKKRGVEVSYYDELLSDIFICETSLSIEQIRGMQYVYDVKGPREGTLLDK